MFSSMILAFAAAVSAQAPSTAPAAPMSTAVPASTVYELRIYYPAPGKLAALNVRFRNHTLKLFEKAGMRNVAYWNELPTEAAPEGRIIYVLAFPSKAAREASWKAFLDDPEWKSVYAKSEENGTLVAKIDNAFMTAADYSPSRP